MAQSATERVRGRDLNGDEMIAPSADIFSGYFVSHSSNHFKCNATLYTSPIYPPRRAWFHANLARGIETPGVPLANAHALVRS